MASPTVAGTPATTNDQTAGTSTPITMPAGITAGETLVAWIAHKAPITEAAMSGWTRLIEADQPSGSNATLSVFYKKAAGGDTGTMTTTTSTRAAAVVYRVSGATDPTVTAPEGAAAAGQANSVNPDPPSLTPASGSKDYLFMCGFASSHGRITSAVPTNYGDSQTAGPNNGTATNVGVGVADRALTTGAAENPGTFTTTGTGVEEVCSCTILIHPAAAGGTNFPLDAQPGSYTLTGSVAGALASRIVNASPGSYAVTGSVAGLIAARLINAAPGSYVVTGDTAGLALERVLSADPGSYTITGIAATLQGPAVSFEIDAQPGSFTITGSAAGLIADRLLDASPGSYVVTGQLAGLIRDALISASPGSYTVTGDTAGLIAGYVISALAGEYTLTGFDATLQGPGAQEVVIRLRMSMGIGQ